MRKPFGRSRPVPEAGKYYRNGAGQVRQVVAIDGDILTFEVMHSGPGNHPRQICVSHDRGVLASVKIKSFRTWLTHECDREGNIIDHGLSIPTPRTMGKLASAIRENLEKSKKIP